MSATKLAISDDLALPLDAVTQTFAIMAKRGVGKTHTASVMAEEMLKQGQPIVVYDPTSAWYGLKSSVDGKKPAYPVVIFGGEHADVPLEENAGETIASVVVEKRIPAILDCGLMRKGARIRFMTAFCETLYHKNREPLHFFIDEAQTVAPQNLKAMPEIARLVGALEDIILQGRRRGLGVTVISPRPAIVNTSIRSACEVLIAMQIVGPHDRKAIQEWVDLHGDDAERAKEMMVSLASLKRGEAWVWSPSWLALFTRTRFRKRETFDSSATPEIGGRAVSPAKMAAVDLEKLGAEIAATVERAKDNDPEALKRRIGDLARKLEQAEQRERHALQNVSRNVEIERVEVPVIKREHLTQLKEYALHLTKAVERTEKLHETMRDTITDGSTRIIELFGVLRRASDAPSSPARAVTAAVHAKQPLAPRTAMALATTAKAAAHAMADGNVSRPQQMILNVLAMFESIRLYTVPRESVAVLAGTTPRSSGFEKNVSTLRTLGLIAYPVSGLIELTDEGRKRATPAVEIQGLVHLHEAWFRAVSNPQAAMLHTLTEVYPNDISREELATHLREHGVQCSVTSSGFEKNLSTLRTLGAIDYPSKGRVRATEMLFPNGLQ